MMIFKPESSLSLSLSLSLLGKSLKRAVPVVCGVTLFLGGSTAAFAWQTTIRYVDASLPVSGVHNGETWATGYRTITPALLDAANDAGIKEVWVAKGTYTPDPTGLTDPKMASFTTPDRFLKLIGGFVNGMSSQGERFPGDFRRTILDGDLGNGDRSYNVVRVPRSPTAGNHVAAGGLQIDGFVIRNGFAGGSAQSHLGHHSLNGGGIHCDSTNLNIDNCFFENNYAAENGGGVYFKGKWVDTIDPEIVRLGYISILASEFIGNFASITGGGLYMKEWASFPEIYSSHVYSTLFHRNLAGADSYEIGGACHAQGGGAIAIGPREAGASLAFQNDVFSSNFVRGWGSAVWSLSAIPGQSLSEGVFEWSNCTFTNNAVIDPPLCPSLGGASAIHETGTVVMDGTGTVSNSIFWNNQGVSQTGGLPDTRDGVKPDSLTNWQHLYSDIETYAGGTLPTPFGNISQDPLFTNSLLLDYTLQVSSPCIDVGSQDLVLLDYPDGNNTPLTVETVLYEFNLALPRSVDFVAGQSCTPAGPNTTCGEVDMGAFERQ